MAIPVRQVEATEMDEIRVIRLRLKGPSSDGHLNGAVPLTPLPLSNFLNKRHVKTYSNIDSRPKRRGL